MKKCTKKIKKNQELKGGKIENKGAIKNWHMSPRQKKPNPKYNMEMGVYQQKFGNAKQSWYKAAHTRATQIQHGAWKSEVDKEKKNIAMVSSLIQHACGNECV